MQRNASSERSRSCVIVTEMPRGAQTLALTFAVTLAIVCGATPVAAQPAQPVLSAQPALPAQIDTRAEVLARQRAEKATQLQPYQPARIEKALLFVENSRIVKRLSPRNGFFIQYGYTGKPVGSGTAF